MPKSKIILAIGCFIALLPVLGFPHAWESFFEVMGGLGIVLLSVLITVDRRMTLRLKAERRHHNRRVNQARVAEGLVEESVIDEEQEDAQT